MKTNITANASRMFNKLGLQIKKHSPEILMTVGIVGTVASTVLACKATTKLDKILEEKKATTDIIYEGMKNGNIEGHEYTEQDGKRDLTIVYGQTGVKLVKLYAPAIALGAASIACIVGGHRILKKRNLALAAAYTVVDKGFKDYRKNVVNRFGEQIDKELRYNIKAKEFEKEVVDEKGKKTTKKEIVEVADPLSEISDYARFYDDGCTGWTKDPEYNLLFLRKQQDYANDKLRTQGYLFLNEVYDMLGMPRSKMGHAVGWVYNGKSKHCDSYVDFGIYNTHREANRNFVNGYERTILLDFNVDGNILDLIERY